MQLWRLREGKTPENSPSGRRLREALELDGLATLLAEVSSTVRTLVAEDPARAASVLSMLRSVTSLTTRPGNRT